METAKTFLYLLQLKDGRHFKIGIATSNSRIQTHDRNYGIDRSKSYIVECYKDRSIIILEKHLLNVFSNTDIDITEFKGIDGATEIRSVDHLKPCLQEIKKQNRILGFKIHKMNNRILQSKERETISHISKSNIETINEYCTALQKWINSIKIEAICKGKEYITLKIKGNIEYQQDLNWSFTNKFDNYYIGFNNITRYTENDILISLCRIKILEPPILSKEEVNTLRKLYSFLMKKCEIRFQSEPIDIFNNFVNGLAMP
jgi:hypothetical protein